MSFFQQDKGSEAVLVKSDAYMGDIVEAMRQGLLQGMHVELNFKRIFFGKSEDYKRDPKFTELSFFQVCSCTPLPHSLSSVLQTVKMQRNAWNELFDFKRCSLLYKQCYYSMHESWNMK